MASRRRFLSGLGAIGLLAGIDPAQAGTDAVVIHAGRLIDGISPAARDRITVRIEAGRVASVEAGFRPAGRAALIDLSAATVLPGLIDCHTHLTGQSDGRDPLVKAVTRTPLDDAFRAAIYARRTLEAGFTSARDLGGDTGLVVALKRAIEEGTVLGPRLWVSGSALGPTGGHSDRENGLNPEISVERWRQAVIDGPEAAVVAVRTLRKRGADLVKIMPSGGVLSRGDDPNRQLMTDAEIAAVVETAHGLGMKVAAHAHGKTAIEHAIRLGCDSIEHGSYADAETFALYRASGTWLVPTLLVAETAARLAHERPAAMNPGSAAKALEVAPRLLRMVGEAHRAGVRIAFGTDQSLAPHGENAREFALMVRAGMTPMQAITAATASAAELIGATGDIGSVQPGRWADLIAVRGDPLADITELERPVWVMKGGAVVKGAA